MGNSISYYERASDVKSQETIPFDIFLENIRSGQWQDLVNAIRIIKDKDERDKAKKRLPNVTISGTFSERYDKNQLTHSGYIGIDIDNCNPEEVKNLLSSDRYIVAAFQSVSGRGVCCIIKVKPEKHKEAFRGFCEYLYNTYSLVADPTSINPSRARFVSFDPGIYIADVCDKFAIYAKEKAPKKIDKVIYSKDDFTHVLDQIVSRQVNLTENYHEWLRMAFALIHQFGDGGREYFHIISQYSTKYDSETTDKQFTACLKHKGSNEVTISTFYYYAKEANLEIYSERTKKIAYTSAQGKKGGLNQSQVEENLKRFEDIDGDDVAGIIKQVFENNIELDEDTLIDQLEMWIKHNYALKRNEITRYIENDSKVFKLEDFNTVFIRGKKVLDKINYELIDRLIHSHFIPTYNPLKEYFQSLENPLEGGVQEQLTSALKHGPRLTPTEVVELLEQHFPLITALFGTITTKDPQYALYFGAKWLTGVVSSVYGEHNPLMLTLSGDVQNTGKTQWFRRLAPKSLKPYYAESKLDRGKDDEILMTQKLIIMDDEMGGKSKKEISQLKTLTSASVFTLREPYGRGNVDLIRLANLCATTNEEGILFDPTGNRRVIPIKVFAINHKAYNKIDKDGLFAEMYALYSCGLRWELTSDDIEYLGVDSQQFESLNMEGELIGKYFKPGTDTHLTATDVKVYMESRTGQRLSLDKIGKELKRLRFEQKFTRVNGTHKRLYGVTYLVPHENLPDKPNDTDSDDDLPF